MNQMLKGFPQIKGYTDDLFDKLSKDWESVNRSIFDLANKMKDERALLETSYDELIRQGKATEQEKKLWLEEYDKMMMDTLEKEDAKRKEIIRDYTKGLEKALDDEQKKLDKMVDDYNKRVLDRERESGDARLKVQDYDYRQTHNAEEKDG